MERTFLRKHPHWTPSRAPSGSYTDAEPEHNIDAFLGTTEPGSRIDSVDKYQDPACAAIESAHTPSPFPQPSLRGRRRKKSSGSHAYRVRNWIWENEKMVWGESRRKSVRTHRRGDGKIKANLPEGNEKAGGTD
ncbi:unnamed protein product [Rhizoctonia solani]|uniref:Uncharacterized protein n=1 Tax=Rhizoctonia solani TaxID=456999 RepID=A0A8H3CGA4_9AGAM|nr:unnamed protein product [Rhizoctonia solani]